MTSHIIPTIFAHNKKEFDERFKKLFPVSKNLQIDFMDGKFVPAHSVQINEIPNLKKYKNNFEAHLMCFNPEKYVRLAKENGFKKIIFHIEATNNSEKIIQQIKKEKMQAFVAINPETKIDKILPYLKKTDGVLFMGVHPGKEHQSFIPQVYKNIYELKKINKNIAVQVDGGVNEEVAKKLVNLKVDYLNTGSFVANAENPKEAFKMLNALFLKRKR